jgi:hypothetical protein
MQQQHEVVTPKRQLLTGLLSMEHAVAMIKGAPRQPNIRRPK